MNYPSIAAQIVAAVGGRENLSNVMHCATRLRLTCLDESKIDADTIAELEGVKGVFNAKGQFQIIFGSGTVNQVCDEVLKLTGGQPVQPQPKAEAEGSVINRFIKMLSDIFVPIIPAIVAGGLLMGINNIFTAEGLFVSGKTLIELYPQFADLAGMINLFSNAAFTFLPVLIGFSATEKFGGNPYLGAVLGMIMVHPDLMNAYSYGTGAAVPTWNLFSLSIEAVGYQGTVLPVLVMSFFLAKLETRLHKITPSWLDNLTTPLISILVCGFVTFLAVGPVMRTAGNLLAYGISWLYHSLGFIGGGLFGLFYAPIVLTGMHHSFIAIETQLLAETAVTGGSFIFVTASMNNVAQGAAVLAVLAITKDSKLKSLCSASGISALLGITEPAMFGVNLKLKTPFYAAIIGSAVGSAYVAFHHVLAVALGAAGLPGFISIRPADWLHFAIGLALSMITAFILTLVFTKKQQNPNAKTNAQTDKQNTLPAVDNQTLLSPTAGTVRPIEQSTDGTFSEKLMGDGFVVFPTCGEVCAPINGTVKFIFPTKHAIGLVNADGVEMLIHMGINTVSLNGEPFNILVQEGQNVRAGQPLAAMNLKQIEDAGCSTEICCIFTAPTPFYWTAEGEVAQAQPIISLGEKQ